MRVWPHSLSRQWRVAAQQNIPHCNSAVLPRVLAWPNMRMHNYTGAYEGAFPIRYHLTGIFQSSSDFRYHLGRFLSGRCFCGKMDIFLRRHMELALPCTPEQSTYRH